MQGDLQWSLLLLILDAPSENPSLIALS
jgi:hypothetical protein